MKRPLNLLLVTRLPAPETLSLARFCAFAMDSVAVSMSFAMYVLWMYFRTGTPKAAAGERWR